MRLAVLLGFVGAALFVDSTGAQVPIRPAESISDGLSVSDWSGIRAAYEANRHAVFPVEGGYQARNPDQQWQTRFDGQGFATAPDVGSWEWGLQLVGYGREDGPRTMSTPFCIDSSGQRVEYQWDDVLREWYVNDQHGLEHGYTVQERPGHDAGALQFTLAVRGDLRPRVSDDGRSVTFVNESGMAVVSYAGLTVFDARCAVMPASFEVAQANPQSAIDNPQMLRLAVDDTDAVYPLTIDPIAQQAYLKASNTETNDSFGARVAVSGDTVVVGALAEDSSAMGVDGDQGDNSAVASGAAYVYVRSGGVWSQQAYLKASNTTGSDFFGTSVAVSGDTIVVGATGEDSNATGVDGNQTDNSASNSGAAYVFVRSGGTWSQQAYLKASNTDAFDLFGLAVSVSGDTIVVSATGEDSPNVVSPSSNSLTDAGAAYVFVRNGTVWSHQAFIKALGAGAGDNFGISVGASNDTVVIGANGEDSGIIGNPTDNSAAGAGAAYVLIRNGSTWTHQAYLKASNVEAADNFGFSVAVSADIVVVGADLEDSNATSVNGNQASNSAVNSGAAYIFVRSGTTWNQLAYVKASNTQTGDQFGRAVAVSDETAVIGAWAEDSNATGVDGNQSDNSAASSGAAYVFVRGSGVPPTWSQQAYLKASNTEAGDNFGGILAVSGDTVVVGAVEEDSAAVGVDGNQTDNSAGGSGAAYAFSFDFDPDDDGVPDSDDVCPNTTAGLPVCANGRPQRDCNNDCLYDGGDISCLVDEMLNQ